MTSFDSSTGIDMLANAAHKLSRIAVVKARVDPAERIPASTEATAIAATYYGTQEISRI